MRQHDSFHQKKSRGITQSCIYYDSNHHASPEKRYFTWWIASINSASAPRWNHIKPLPSTHIYAKMTHHMRWWAAQQHSHFPVQTTACFYAYMFLTARERHMLHKQPFIPHWALHLQVCNVLYYLPHEALVVTGWGNLAFQLPVQTWLQWTWVQNELNGAYNQSKKCAVLEAAPNTNVSQYVGTAVPCKGSLHNQPLLYEQIKLAPQNYRRPTKTTWGVSFDIKTSSICAVLLLYKIITNLLFHHHLKVEGIQTSCSGHS